MADEAGAALGEGEADRCFAILPRDAPCLLAVSGGPDSTALMGLAALWARRHGCPQPHIAVVDHGLRPGSDAEAQAVQRRAAQLGLDCSILDWDGPKPQSGLQRAAREARYRLLGAHARATGAAAVVTAHTLDDQAETVLMRLAHGSGPAGLRGMRARGEVEGVALLRPFLEQTKARLLATCGTHGWPWIGDPSNRDTRFERTRWRQLMPLLAAEGLDAGRIGLFARRLAQVDEAITQIARAALASAALPAAGSASEALAFGRLAELPFAVACRALAIWLEGAGGIAAEDAGEGAWRPLRLNRLEAALGRLITAQGARRGLTLTLAGQVIELDGAGRLMRRPERRRRGVVNPVGGALLGKPGCDD